MACVDHAPFIIGIIYKSLKYSFPKPFVSPPAETSIDVVSATIFKWQIMPWRSILNIQNTALINFRLSRALPPHVTFLPGRSGSNKAHTSLLMSYLSMVIFRHLFGLHSAFKGIKIKYLLLTLSKYICTALLLGERPL